MATMVKFNAQKKEIVDETYRRINEAEENRAREFEAVVKIQAWFRAQRVRSYLKHLSNSALAIQKRWRGFTGRKRFREILKQRVFIMKLNLYNSKATKIQKVWRGYYIRKYVFNYYSRKKYLEGLQIKNEMVRNELAEYAEYQEMNRQIQQEAAETKRRNEWAERNHHLLSTTVIPGIYNSPYQPYPDEQEYHLKNVKPRAQIRKSNEAVLDPTCSRYDLPVIDPLPPIGPKPQGPFRQPGEVQRQRYKQFQPTLRVETDYLSLEKARQDMKQEEWVTRLNDNIFLPFKRKNNPYEPYLHTTSKYGHLPYGTRYFREEHVEQFSSSQNFKTLVPPIPVFEKLNDTYSQGQV